MKRAFAGALDWLPWRRGTPLAGVRWVAIDTETTGLDPRRDRLLSIGAVAVEHGRIQLADAYAAMVGQAAPSAPENIVVHGIGGDAQLAGRPRGEALAGLESFIGDRVPVGFNAGFDAAMLGRPIAVDLAQIAPAIDPEHARGLYTLDDWLQRYGIETAARHDALDDAYSTAQLLLVVLSRAEAQHVGTLESLLRLAGAHRWLPS